MNPLELREDGLYAHVRFTDRAADAIRTGELRFTSAVWDFNAVDRRSGEPLPLVLDSVALTNKPFVDGLAPIVLADEEDATWVHIAIEGTWKGHHSTPSFTLTNELFTQAIETAAKNRTPLVVDYDHESLNNTAAPAAGWIALSRVNPGETMDAAAQLAMIAEACGLEKSADGSAIVEAVKAMVGLDKAQSGEASPEPSADASPPEPVDNKVANSQPVDAAIAAPEADANAALEIAQIISDAAGLDMAGVLAMLREKSDQLASLLKADAPNGSPAGDGQPVANSRKNPALTVALSQRDEARKELDTLKSKLLEAEVDDAIKEGRILPVYREDMIELARTNKKAFIALTANAQAVPTGRQAGDTKPTDTLPELSAAEEVAASILKAAGATETNARKRVANTRKGV